MKYIPEIVKAFGTVEGEIRKSLLGFNISSFSEIKAGQIRKRLGGLLDGLNIYAAKWLRRAVPANYAESQARARTRLEFIGAKRANDFGQHHVDNVRRFEDAILKDFIKATSAMRMMIGKYFYATGRASDSLRQIQEFDTGGLFDEDVIDDIIRKAMIEHQARGAVSKRIADYLRENLMGGNYINIRGRNYNVKSYAELVARTRMREAQTEATKELCKEFENDLVQWSKHDNPCDECAKYEGEVFSLSGDSDKYEKLPDEAEPPVHPNCEHNLNPTSENALSWRNA